MTVGVPVVCMALLLTVATAFAQSIMDSSGDNISPREKASLIELLRANLSDPFGSQLISLAQAPDNRVCGQVNAKNRMGGFVGFRPFVADLAAKRLTLLPDLDGFDITHPQAETRLALANLAIAEVKDACGSKEADERAPEKNSSDKFP